METRTRTIQIDHERADSGARTVPASLSSNRAVRWADGSIEILEHSPEAVDLSRAPLPLITSHDRDQLPVGIAEQLRIDGGKLRGVLRFGGSARAREIFDDVKAGIVRNLSIGYSINQAEEIEGGYKATRWTPFEVSIVSCPADQTVGIGRQFEGKKMGEKDQQQNQRSQTEINEEIRNTERTRVREINAIASMLAEKAPAVRQAADKAIQDGTSLDQFRGIALKLSSNAQPVGHRDGVIGMSRHEVEQYSILKAARALQTGQFDGLGIEMEASKAVEKQMGRSANGLFVPFDILGGPERQRDITTLNTGQYITQNETMGFIDFLRKRNVVLRAGATVLSGLQAFVDIPKQTNISSAVWVDEGEDVSESGPTFGKIHLSPKTCGVYVDMTRRMLQTSNYDIEALVREDLREVLSAAIDEAALNGTGLSHQPLGVLNYDGVSEVAMGDNAGDPTWSKIVEFETKLANADADVGNLAYVTNSKVRGHAKAIEKASGTAEFLWSEAVSSSKLNGYPVYISNRIPSNYTKGSHTDENLSAMIFGNWRDLIIGLWGAGIEIKADPYTLGLSGGLRLIALVDTDMAIRRVESFCVCKDIRTSPIP